MASEIFLIIPTCTDKLWTPRSTEDLLSTPGGTRVRLTLKTFCKRSPEKNSEKAIREMGDFLVCVNCKRENRRFIYLHAVHCNLWDLSKNALKWRDFTTQCLEWWPNEQKRKLNNEFPQWISCQSCSSQSVEQSDRPTSTVVLLLRGSKSSIDI